MKTIKTKNKEIKNTGTPCKKDHKIGQNYIFFKFNIKARRESQVNNFQHYCFYYFQHNLFLLTCKYSFISLISKYQSDFSIIVSRLRAPFFICVHLRKYFFLKQLEFIITNHLFIYTKIGKHFSNGINHNGRTTEIIFDILRCRMINEIRV